MASLGNRSDPYLSFNFLVKIDGIEAGGFTDVSGLEIKTEVQRKRFGGEHDHEYTFVNGIKYTDLTLKHGITDADVLWKWCEKVLKGTIERKNGSIYLRNQAGENVMQWDFKEAFPIEWSGPSFNAASNTVALETLVLSHHGLQRI